MHFIGFQLHASKQERKSALKRPMYYVSQDAKAVFSRWTAKQCSRWSTMPQYFAVSPVMKVGTKRLIHGFRKQTQFCVSFVALWWKRELSKTTKISLFKSVFIPILICDHESWVVTEIILSQEQAAEMGFLRRVQGVTLCDKMHRFEIRKARNVKPLLRIERSQLRWFGNVSRISQERLARQVFLATSTGKQPRGLPRTRWCDYISIFPCFRLGVDRGELSEIAVDREIFRVHLGPLPSQPSPEEKRARKWMNEYGHWNFLFIK